jgi:hypothetical protein
LVLAAAHRPPARLPFAGPYGVQWEDSTMEALVLPHAAAVQRLALQQASGRRCMRDCWVGYRQVLNGSTYRACTRVSCDARFRCCTSPAAVRLGAHQ